ncbi:hypothetical protein BGZ83_000049 [Gryganskiella cystojenkinii]|nr:hypothetical protein BGZ83_000049 [Gryganskiella cystojenkinii]
MAEPSTPSPPSSPAGSNHENEEHDESIEVPDIIQIQLHLRKGVPLVRCRSTKDLPNPPPFEYNIAHDSFDHLLQLVRSHLPVVPGRSWPQESRPYLQPAHTTPQKKYKEMDPEIYKARMEKAWRVSFKRSAKENLSEPVCVHFFIYLVSGSDVKKPKVLLPSTHSIASSSASSSNGGSSSTVVRKATNGSGETSSLPEPSKARIEEAHALIATAIEEKRLAIGPLTATYYARYLAGLKSFPSSNEQLVIPQTDDFKDAQQLDAMARPLLEKRRAEEALERDPYRTVRMKLNGTEVPVQIHLKSLREALGL